MKLLRRIREQYAFFIGASTLVWQIFFFYAPILFIFWLSFITLSYKGEVLQITFQNYHGFFSAIYLWLIGRSLLLGMCTAFASLIIGYSLAYWLVFKTGRFKNILLFLLLLPFFTSFLLHVYAWFFVLERGGFLNTFLYSLGIIREPLTFLNTRGAVALMMLYYYLPFMILPIYSALERIDIRLLEASFDLGASWWQTFRWVLLPMTIRGIQLGFFLVYVPACAEFAIPDLMGGAKDMFVGNMITNYVLGTSTLPVGAALTIFGCSMIIMSALLLQKLLHHFLLLGIGD